MRIWIGNSPAPRSAATLRPLSPAPTMPTRHSRVEPVVSSMRRGSIRPTRARLVPPERAVSSRLENETLVLPFGNDLAVLERVNAIGLADRRKTMSDHDDGATGLSPAQSPSDARL